jgi:hypothetical protein
MEERFIYYGITGKRGVDGMGTEDLEGAGLTIQLAVKGMRGGRVCVRTCCV